MTINDNVFVGNDTTILKGVEIGENTIIAANSLVNEDVPADTVAGGVPAQPIMSIDEYYERRKEEYVAEAKAYARSIEERRGRPPEKEDFGEFFPLFLERSEEALVPHFRRRITDGRRFSEDAVADFLQTEPEFDSFEDFLDHCDE